jgi:hypothetical protein
MDVRHYLAELVVTERLIWRRLWDEFPTRIKDVVLALLSGGES